jgi:hypothetical protein
MRFCQIRVKRCDKPGLPGLLRAQTPANQIDLTASGMAWLDQRQRATYLPPDHAAAHVPSSPSPHRIRGRVMVRTAETCLTK